MDLQLYLNLLLSILFQSIYFNDKVVIGIRFMDGKAIVGTVSGTSISFGSELHLILVLLIMFQHI